METEELKKVIMDEGMSLDDKRRILDENKVAYRVENGLVVLDGMLAGRVLLSCINDIVKRTTSLDDNDESVFNESILTDAAGPIGYVCSRLGITPMQAVIYSTLMEHYSLDLDMKGLSDYLGISGIRLLTYDVELEDLRRKGLVNRDKKSISLRIPRFIVYNLARHGVPFMREYANLDTYRILEMMDCLFERRTDNRDAISERDLVNEIDTLLDANRENAFAIAVRGLGLHDHDSRLILYTLVWHYQIMDDDRVNWHDISHVLSDKFRARSLERQFKKKYIKIARDEIAVPVMTNGMASSGEIQLSRDAKEKLFADIGGCREDDNDIPLNAVKPEEIAAKELFYNPCEGEQIGHLTDLLGDDRYRQTCERLKERGLRTGFSCLFYGGPGTGKTETVYQIARLTGRPLIPVCVQEIKSCWVGESEKRMKAVFDRYRAMAERSKATPILLFNEADAIFGLRNENATRAADKMENSLQNIILQEMENLNGILIATTNLTCNLDKAFERRFLYKIEFSRPTPEVKSRIWQSLIPDLTQDQSLELSKLYDFSGGQIENISHKMEVSYVLYGRKPDFEEIMSYCGEETISGHTVNRTVIGFRH